MCPCESREPIRSSPSGVGRSFIARGLSVVLIVLARFYQMAISPHLVGSCKFVPSCSRYFIGAVEKHGPWRGFMLGVKRLLRCHPFSQGGIDPVPE